jgi:hypothetical protein
MGVLLERFRERLDEVEHYFRMLRAIESSIALMGTPRRKVRLPKVLKDELSLKLLKATSFLLLYNLTEATVRDTVEAVWESVGTSGTTPLELKASLRGVWVGAEFRRKDAFSASGSTYREATLAILEGAASGTVPRVDFKRVGLGGNIDKSTIDDICAGHGIQFRAPRNSRAGIDLNDVKGRRNVLAHGEQTFEEVGSRYTVDDLHHMKIRVAAYLRQFVRRVERYVVDRGYRAPEARLSSGS